MLTVPTTTRQYRRNLPSGRVGRVMLLDRIGTIDVRIPWVICSPFVTNRPLQLRFQLPTEPDLPIAA
jgi:hypothetical protein